MLRGAMVIVWAAWILFAAPAAMGASAAPNPLSPSNSTSPLSPGIPTSQAPTATTSTTPPVVSTTPGTTTSSGGNGLSGTNAVVIALGALVILGGIAFFIWRDARRRAPLRARAAAIGPDAGRSRTGSKQRGKPRKLSPAERRRRKRGRAR
jgi:hypothetical protein